MGRGCGRCSLLVLLPFALCCYVRKKTAGRRKEKGEGKEKKMKKNSKLENF
jgi:hypothetical protein